MMRHFCQSVEGALKNWKRREWVSIMKSNSLKSVEEAQELFWKLHSEGKRVIPIGDCDNFDFKTGCRGHESKNANG